MLKVFIVDDEDIVREGLKKIIDWNALNFTICGEAADGLSALNAILELQPDLVLLDIRMPKLHGLELAALAREQGFIGKIIILSGYSEFKYAQDAIKCNVDFYLNKPIDEDELFETVKSIRNTLQKEALHSQHINYYREKAKYRILHDMIQPPTDSTQKSLASIEVNLTDLELEADGYQIIILEHLTEIKLNVHEEICKLLKTSVNTTSIEHLNQHQMDVILLKGHVILGRFNDLVTQTNSAQSIGPIPFFIAAGRAVTHMNEIYFSYHDALAIKEYRFFCSPQQRIVLISQLPNVTALSYTLTTDDSKQYATLIYQTIQTYNRLGCEEVLDTLKHLISKAENSVEYIKTFLSGLYLQIIFVIAQDYPNAEIHFPNNSEIIQYIHNRIYLSEILDYFLEHFDDVIKKIRNTSSESILDDLINYIHHNYKKNLKLETLATLFGYNSSYLGKVLTKKLGQNFNSYLDHVRIEKSKELLLNKSLKVYEIAESVGYKNVNDFHKKFKKHVGNSPAEYRGM